MDRVTVQEVETDSCSICGSVWLDKGELGQLVHVPADALGTMLNAGQEGAAPPLSAAVVLNCPACPGSLQTLSFAGHRVDRCDQCKGLLFERGHVDSGIQAIRQAFAKTQG